MGGRFREEGEKVYNSILDLAVPKSMDVLNYMNSFLNSDFSSDFIKHYQDENIINYINYSIEITSKMLSKQPFVAGNEITFISLLNLLFKLRNIPPIFIEGKEMDVWKKALYKAVKDTNNIDYSDLFDFYYYKIVKSIYELDLSFYSFDDQSMTSKI